MIVLLEFLACFAFFLTVGCLVPAGYCYWAYHARSGLNHIPPIQARRPALGQVRREVLMSLSTITIFAAMSTGLCELFRAGHTSLYLRALD